jgi:hypothetical protein
MDTLAAADELQRLALAVRSTVTDDIARINGAGLIWFGSSFIVAAVRFRTILCGQTAR